MQEVVVRENKQRESPPTSWPTGTMGMDVPSFTERLRRAQAFNRGSVDKAAETEVEERAQFDELLHAHLALPVQDVPQPLFVHANAASKLGYANSAATPSMLDTINNACFNI